MPTPQSLSESSPETPGTDRFPIIQHPPTSPPTPQTPPPPHQHHPRFAARGPGVGPGATLSYGNTCPGETAQERGGDGERKGVRKRSLAAPADSSAFDRQSPAHQTRMACQMEEAQRSLPLLTPTDVSHPGSLAWAGC
ncbi:unnamed protein product [Arctogadus glacialis]